MNKVVDFFLTPDGPSSRKVRKYLAFNAPGLNRIVGSWPELMVQVRSAYLLQPASSSWTDKLAECAILIGSKKKRLDIRRTCSVKMKI